MPDRWAELPNHEKQRRTKLAQSCVTDQEREALARMKTASLPSAESVIVHATNDYWPKELDRVALDAMMVARAIRRSQYIYTYGQHPEEKK